MSSLSNGSSFAKRKPVPVSEQDYGDSKTKKQLDPNISNQAPRAPAKSPLRTSGLTNGKQNAPPTPISGSTQTTTLQPVMSTMTITSAPTVSTVQTQNAS